MTVQNTFITNSQSPRKKRPRKRTTAGALPLLAVMSCHSPLTSAFSTTLSPLISPQAQASLGTPLTDRVDRSTISPRPFRKDLDSWGHWEHHSANLSGVSSSGILPTVTSSVGLSSSSPAYLFNQPIIPMPAWYPQYPHQQITHSEAHQCLLTFQDRLSTSSYLSLNEIESLIHAMKVSTGGDAYQLTGVMDFIKILVDSMEMGVDTLIAACFHYCACFTAKETFILFSSSNLHSQVDIWDQVQTKEEERMHDFSNEARKIAQDTAILKRTEMVSASISSVEEYDARWGVSESSSAVRTDRMDSINMRFLLVSEAQNWKSLAIRTAACLYRLEGIAKHRFDAEKSGSDVDGLLLEEESSLHVHVAREALYIYAPLASRLGMHRLKNEIENTAFRILYRRQYDAVMAMTHNQELNHVLQSITEDVTDLLYEDPSFGKYAQRVKVTARVKEPYSLWRKMKKLNAKSLLDVPDVLALRVVLDAKKMQGDEPEQVTRSRDVELCHYVQQLCIRAFPMCKGGRFKDYIAKPKSNGYQSLHCTALKELDDVAWPFEIQVRSSIMHQVAEFGLAAHWNYKEHGEETITNPGGRKDCLEDNQNLPFNSAEIWENQSSTVSFAPISSYSTLVSSLSKEDNERQARFLASEESRAPYLAALHLHKQNITREKVYIFLKSLEDSSSTKNATTRRVGKLLDLPAGSCVLDAIRECERTLGWTVSLGHDAWLNDEVVSASQKLANGDIVTIKGDFASSNGSLSP